MSLVGLLITILILGLIFAVIWWGINTIALPAPFKTVAVGIFVIIVVIVLVGLLTGNVSIPLLKLT